MDKAHKKPPIGKVVSLWRYPVKSMLGEELNSSYVTERGLLGDRVYALIDHQTGKVASAKNPGKWARLFDCRAVFIDSLHQQVVQNKKEHDDGAINSIPRVRITLPDGTQIFSDDGSVDSTLSKVFSREVSVIKAISNSSNMEKPSYEEYWPDIEGLAQRETVTDESMPPHTFFDVAVIHLMTTSTINRLRELYPEGRFEVRRFRPNIVVESAAAATGSKEEQEEEKNDFIENSWVGKNLTIGEEEIVLRVIGPCTRCVMTTLPQGDLPKDLGILRTVAKYNQVHAGVYASVQRAGGTIRRGDAVRLED